MDKTRNAVVITGTSTVGKTQIALKLAKKLDGELINTDRLHFYNFPVIGTTLTEYAREGEVVKHLYSILDPSDRPPTSKEFLDMVERTTIEVISRGKTAVLEGCACKYVASIIQANNLAERKFFYHPVIGISLSNEDLTTAIKKKAQSMLDDGILDEVRDAQRRGLEESYPIKNALVYTEFLKYPRGEQSLEIATQKTLEKVTFAIQEQKRTYDAMPGLTWVNRVLGKEDDTVDEIVRIMESSPRTILSSQDRAFFDYYLTVGRLPSDG